MTTHHATPEAPKAARYCFKSGEQYATQHNSTCYLGAKSDYLTGKLNECGIEVMTQKEAALRAAGKGGGK